MHDPSGPTSDNPTGLNAGSSHFSETWLGKSLLTVAVIGLTGALIAYSVMASFHAPPAMRRMQSPDRDASIAVHGRVLCMQQPDVVADTGAVVVAWPDSLPTPKYHLTATEAFDSRVPAHQPNISLATADNEGRYTLYREQPTLGRGNSSYHFVLAISKNVNRESPPRENDLQRLATYFAEPLKLLADREYELELILLEANGSTDHTFLLHGRDAQSDSAVTDDAAEKLEPRSSQHSIESGDRAAAPVPE